MTLAALSERYGRWQARWRDPMLTALLVLLSLEVFFGLPLLHTSFLDARVFAGAWLVMIISAVLVAARHWIAIVAMMVSSMAALVANVLRMDSPTTTLICVASGSILVFMMTLAGIVWSAVFGPGQVTHHRIRGAVVLYLSIALSFAAVYEMLLALLPGAISGAVVHGKYLVLSQSMVYYSFTTLTSTGYGDLVPIHPLVRSLSNMESVIGQLYPATLLARIVTLELHGRPHP